MGSAFYVISSDRHLHAFRLQGRSTPSKTFAPWRLPFPGGRMKPGSLGAIKETYNKDPSLSIHAKKHLPLALHITCKEHDQIQH
jgi:hypothetical protein